MRSVAALLCALVLGVQGRAQTDSLPSWNDGAAKKAIVEFVQATTTQGGPQFVPPAGRIATFDQDGTLWVEHPMYTQVVYCLERVAAVVKAKPALAHIGPARGLPDTKVGTFTQALYDEAQKDGWIVISMKSDWKRIFAFEPPSGQ